MWRRSLFLPAEWWHFSNIFGNGNPYYRNIELGTKCLQTFFLQGFHSADKLVNRRFSLAQKISATPFFVYQVSFPSFFLCKASTCGDLLFFGVVVRVAKPGVIKLPFFFGSNNANVLSF